MLHHHVVEVSMESTSVYWIPIWRVLSPYFKLNLANPYFIKQLPCRKSDVKDAQWIAECTMKELIRGSFVPPEIIQQLRQYDRRIFDLNEEIVRKLSKLDAVLQRCNIRLSNYVSNVYSKSYKAVVRAISQGITAPEELKRLQTTPGIKERAATTLIAEIGTDMNKFETANHLASWSGLKPRNDESNKKIKSRSITHGNVYLRKTIIECAWAASRTKDCFFGRFSYHQTQVRKKNKMKVLVAVARKMLIAVWHVLHDNTIYIDFTTDRKTSQTRG